MWNIFKTKAATHTPGDEAERLHKDLQNKIEERLELLVQKMKDCGECLEGYAIVTGREKGIVESFEEMMGALQGLAGLVGQLVVDYGKHRQEVGEAEKMRNMLGNQNQIIKDIQEQHSSQIDHLKQKHQQEQNQMEAMIETLKQDNQEQSHRIKEMTQSVDRLKKENQSLCQGKEQLQQEMQKMSQRVEKNAKKYDIIVQPGKEEQKKQPPQPQMWQLLRRKTIKDTIFAFLNLTDITALSQASHYTRSAVLPVLPKLVQIIIAKKLKYEEQEQLDSVKYYEKVYQQFPGDNIRANAIKYLYFRLKPAGYLLPYLQQENPQDLNPQPHQAKNSNSSFNWKSLFTNDKNKKEDKLTVAQLANSQQFKKVQTKLEGAFKHVLDLQLPNDLKYFAQTMERQLKELKQSLQECRKTEGGAIEWTAQLHCLCRFVYLEISQMHNLLQVVFGELVTKGKQLSTTTDRCEQLQENQNVLRNLIEQLSQSRAQAQKKAVLMENQLLKHTLQIESLSNTLHQSQKNIAQLQAKYDTLHEQHSKSEAVLQKFQQQRQYIQTTFSKIREHIDTLDKPKH